MTARKHETATCPLCGAKVGTYVPAQGDGSLIVLRPHGPRTQLCLGSNRNPDLNDPVRGVRS